MSTFFLRSITRIHDCAKSKIVRIATAQCHLMVALVRQLRGECYFLVSEQESNQRSRLGESVVGLAPAIPSTLPQTPSRPHRRWCRYSHQQLKISFLLKSCAAPTKCGNGSTCNRRAWGILKGNGVSRGSARRPLKPTSLVTFLFGTRK